MARSRESLWLGLAGLLGTAGGTMAGLAAAFSAHESVWSSPAMIGAYVAFGCAAACFGGAVRDLPIPWTTSRDIRPASASDPGDGLHARKVGDFSPFDLQVHEAFLPATGAGALGHALTLTPYLERSHDRQLRAVLEPAVRGGPSMLVVLAGDSCTGKTRAMYEAARGLMSNWPLLAPADAEQLIHLLRRGEFRPGRLLWLNEMHRHLSGAAGGQAAALLRNVLTTTDGAVALGALWPHPYLAALTAVGNDPDTNANARALLIDCPRTWRLDVPASLTMDQQRELAVIGTEDQRIRAALEASGPEGNVIQHLTGGPELMRAYANDSQFTPPEHALITAALDARRLGHQSPLPAGLLAAAADGFLSDRQRPGEAGWASAALSSLASGVRPDGTVTSIRRALTALKTVRSHSGDAETAYEPDDYLDQHTRSARAGQLGTKALWNALIKQTTSPDDLDQLANAAYEKGLYRYAACLWKRAVAAGHPRAAVTLITFLHTVDEQIAQSAGQWAASRATLENAADAAWLLETLRTIGADKGVTDRVVDRAAAQVVLDDAAGAAWLLEALHAVEAGMEPVSVVAGCTAGRVDLHDPWSAARLLEALDLVGADRSLILTVADRAVQRDALGDFVDATRLLEALNKIRAGHLLVRAAELAAATTAISDPVDAAWLLQALHEVGVDAAEHRAIERVASTTSAGAAELLEALQLVGADQAVIARVADHVAENVPFTEPTETGQLIEALYKVGAENALVATMSQRAADWALTNQLADARLLAVLCKAHLSKAELGRIGEIASFDDAADTGDLLKALHAAGADHDLVVLVAGRAADRVVLDDASNAAWLLEALHEAGAGRSWVSRVAERAANEAAVDDPAGTLQLLATLHSVEADQTLIMNVADRAANRATADDPQSTRWLLDALGKGEADSRSAAIAGTRVGQGRWRFNATSPGGKAELPFGREVSGEPSVAWSWDQLADPD